MINQYLKHGIRRMWKNKFFYAINLLGLSIGISSFLILFVYTANEKSYDTHLKHYDNMYRVSSAPVGQHGDKWARSLGMIHEAATSIPEVENSSWFCHTSVGSVKINNQTLQQKDILSVDYNFMDLFDVEPLMGDLLEITKPNTVFISERFAKKYFKNENPIGKTIDIESLQYDQALGTFEIRGVVKNTHPKTHLNYELLLSQNGLLSERYISIPDHKWLWAYNYFVLKEGANTIEVADKLHEHFTTTSLMNIPGPKDYKFSLTPVSDIHLKTNHRFELKESTSKINIGLFITISMVILLLSLFNFTNLTIAGLLKRFNEFSLKQSVGATKLQLIFQILSEVMLLCTAAIILSFGSIELLKPTINNFFNIHFNIYFNEPIVYISILLVLAICMSLTLLFTLLLFRRQNKSYKSLSSNNRVMQPLLITQVAIVIVLIASTFLVNKQINFMLKSPLGFEKENVVVLHLIDASKDPAIFANELKKQSQIVSVGFARQHFGYPAQTLQLDPFGLEGSGTMVYANYDYLKTMNIQLTKNWIKPDTDTIKGMVINEHLYKKLLEKHGSMEALKLYQANKTSEGGQSIFSFIGVVKDFNYSSAHDAIGDFAFWLNEWRGNARYIHVRLNPGNPHVAIEKIKQAWDSYYSTQEFNYFFIDDKIAQQYRAETILSRILKSFSLIGILISIIGISSLSLFISQQRTKEIGVRKVNGAKIPEVLAMLNRDFIKWVAIAFIIACPIAYYTMNKWLENFAYKTELSWWVFVLAGVLALSIALLTVSFQSWRTATRNPVEALRYE